MSRPALRWAAALLAASAVIALSAQAPALLRHIDAFRVDRVEVVGTRHLAPHAALEASGITRTSSVFDDRRSWKAALLRHPLVAAVSIERKLPSTIVVRIEEVEPVALVRTPDLRPVDAGARTLPIDPAGAELDLPIVDVLTAVAADGRLEDDAALALVEAAARLRTLEPGIAARVSEIAPAAGGGLRLLLREPARAEVLLPAPLEPERLEQLRLTMADLESRDELAGVRGIDVRFRDQVVVSLLSSGES